jgi:hypothetical protein
VEFGRAAPTVRRASPEHSCAQDFLGDHGARFERTLHVSEERHTDVLAGKEKMAAEWPVEERSNMANFSGRRTGISALGPALQRPRHKARVGSAGARIVLVDTPEPPIVERVHCGQVSSFKHA